MAAFDISNLQTAMVKLRDENRAIKQDMSLMKSQLSDALTKISNLEFGCSAMAEMVVGNTGALSKLWNAPEEDKAWEHLQKSD